MRKMGIIYIKCQKCKKKQLLRFYGKTKNIASGYDSTCKKCRKERRIALISNSLDKKVKEVKSVLLFYLVVEKQFCTRFFGIADIEKFFVKATAYHMLRILIAKKIIEKTKIEGITVYNLRKVYDIKSFIKVIDYGGMRK